MQIHVPLPKANLAGVTPVATIAALLLAVLVLRAAIWILPPGI
ncbi:hypothetical protein [Rhizobium sp. SSA_523]|nr:hypothetical protein [Rhizobium sp. SSA_523]WKC23817.1 hypothetical protein QTJ18_24075 [Rhizobium sp. SSA_523]